MSELKIRDAGINDAQGIATVHIKMWQEAYKGQVPDSFLDSMSIEKRTEIWKKELENPYKGTHAFVADIDGTVVGWVTGGVNRDKDVTKETGELYGIYILPGHTGQGIGSELMTRLLGTLKKDGYKKSTLWVLDTNDKTIKWYEKKSWKPEGKTKTEKRDGFDLNEVRYIIDL
jgi:ribosomal protein S18 acetylase RimI-like enzyme